MNPWFGSTHYREFLFKPCRPDSLKLLNLIESKIKKTYRLPVESQEEVRDKIYLRLGLLMLVAERSLGVEPTEPKPERLRVPLNPEVLIVSFFATYRYMK